MVLNVPLAVTFDLWQTLIFESGGSGRSSKRKELRISCIAGFLSAHSEPVNEGFIGYQLQRLSNEIIAGQDLGFDDCLDKRISTLLERLAPGLPDQIGERGVNNLRHCIDDTFLESPPQLVEGVPSLIDSLRQQGIRIGLISNAGLTSGEAQRRWFGTLGLLDRFDYLAFSSDLSVAKPAKKIFELTLDAIGITPEYALHVGDNIHTDIGGSAAVGMSTVWVAGGVQSKLSPATRPDYAINSVLDLRPVVDHWMENLVG